MDYKELCRRINIEKYSNNYLKGKSDSKGLDISIRDISDESKYCFIHINGVQMKFRRLQLGMQRPDDEDLWLLISGREEKSIRVKDIKELYFNYRGWESIHG